MSKETCIGQIFRAERKKQNLSAPKLAAMTGLPLSTIYNFERGVVNNPLFTTVAVLARALHLSLDKLTANVEKTP